MLVPEQCEVRCEGAASSELLLKQIETGDTIATAQHEGTVSEAQHAIERYSKGRHCDSSGNVASSLDRARFQTMTFEYRSQCDMEVRGGWRLAREFVADAQSTHKLGDTGCRLVIREHREEKPIGRVHDRRYK